MEYLLFAALAVFTGIYLFRKTPEPDKKFLVLVFLTAMAIRCYFAVFLTNLAYAEGYRGFVSGDDRLYSLTAMDVLQDIAHGRFTYKLIVFGKNIYTYILAAFYAVFGFKLIASKFINCYIGAIIAVMTYFLTYRFLDKRSARIASLICAFYPSFIFWSSHNFKDPFIELSILIGTYILLKALDLELQIKDLLLLVLFSLLILNLQVLYLYQVGFIIFAIIFLRCSRWLKLTISGSFIIAFTLIAVKTNFLQRLVLSTELRQWTMAISDKAGYYLYSKEFLGEISSGNLNFLSLIALVMKQTAYFLFTPFPWAIRSQEQLLAIPQIMIWYVLFAFFIYGSFKSFKISPVKTSAVLAFVFTGILIRAFLEGNIGAAFRHRDHFAVIIFMYASTGIIYFLNFLNGSKNQR